MSSPALLLSSDRRTYQRWKAGPDASDEEPEFDVKIAVLRHRIVELAETELWPGSYVGCPITFVQPTGETSDQWTYGLVTGYPMQGSIAQIHVHQDAQTLHIRLLSTSTVIAVDRLNYTLRSGAFTNSTVHNALELLDKQNQVITTCGKIRSGLSTSVTTTMLSIPFVPDQRVPLIRSDTLEIVYVRCQPIVDWELTVREQNPTDAFKDPVLMTIESPTAAGATSFAPSFHAANDTDLILSDTDDETKTDSDTTRQAGTDTVHLQNRQLRKRVRYTEVESRDSLLPDDIGVPALETYVGNHGSTFLPSQVERQVSDAIAHPSYIGKNDQAVLEAAQQVRHTKFLATPPVVCAAYEFSFGIRGLSLIHFRRFFEGIEMQTSVASINSTNFGRSNSLRPTTQPAYISEMVDTLVMLVYFAKEFYNNGV
ncbi:hypothetical protein PHYPSEUDO_008352 [Phytophthora pseudosyringae]|uniref:Uncharacterized protein n=1 Tax=Phytophthora pseudosyringae TaxID=221518 RepID=A0A8T1VEU9_9STRA|nr:hypothetical protein PHYPSEUDO_008352 [Phytophthora pseudosyringae]